MKIRRLTESGRQLYRKWLESDRAPGDLPPAELIEGADATEVVVDAEIDPTLSFTTRFEFGRYVASLFAGDQAKELLKQRNDGLWDWLTLVYFSQFGRKNSKAWHYAVTRRGHAGSLAYRHLARTSFEMYFRHGPDSLVMLNVDMATWGDLSEQLTSRQDVAYNRGFIRTANALYVHNGRIVRGAASRVRPAKRRQPGDKVGRGGVARLALAVRRLSRTYDTHTLETAAMIDLLPREFRLFTGKTLRRLET